MKHLTTYNKELYSTYMTMLQANVDQQKNAVGSIDGSKELSEDALSKLLEGIGEVRTIFFSYRVVLSALYADLLI